MLRIEQGIFAERSAALFIGKDFSLRVHLCSVLGTLCFMYASVNR